MRLLLFLITCFPLFAQKHAAFKNWRQADETWIRVGLDKPQRVVRLSCNGPLLVLDGDRVVSTINPDGEFRVIMNKATKGVAYWIQVKAAYNEQALIKTRDALRQSYPDLTVTIVQATSRMKAVRIGPVSDSTAAGSLRRKMVGEGFKDAFQVKVGDSRFAWVDKNFDKHLIQARDLAFVRPDPKKPISFAGKSFRGMVRMHPTGNKIRVINVLPLETYLRGVVPSEMGPRVYPELEALKAQAVAARTYVLKNIRRFNKKGYDICDGPACQAYEGAKNEMALSNEAVDATRGLVLTHQNKLIDALYTSTSGGHTENVENVFPGRAEPYLRGKTEYLAQFKGWDLPPRPVSGNFGEADYEHLTAMSLIYGARAMPDLSGNLDQAFLNELLEDYSWILGKANGIPDTDTISQARFWRIIANLPTLGAAWKNQVQPADADRLLRNHSVPSEMRSFATFMLRYDLISGTDASRFSSEKPMSRAGAVRILLGLCTRLGPEPEWQRHYLEGISNNRIQARKGFKPAEIKLDDIKWYLTERAGKFKFRETALVEERDRIYTLRPPFPRTFLKVRQNGGVASVDRFSVFDYWMEKKDRQTLEKRARRYIKKIRGIRDIKITERSDTGRVTEIQFICDSGTHTARGLRIRWSLGIKDNFFDMIPSYREGKLVHATFVGRGWGHGVGMSQVGAYGLARMGWTFEEILHYYYSQVNIVPFSTLSGPKVPSP